MAAITISQSIIDKESIQRKIQHCVAWFSRIEIVCLIIELTSKMIILSYALSTNKIENQEPMKLAANGIYGWLMLEMSTFGTLSICSLNNIHFTNIHILNSFYCLFLLYMICGRMLVHSFVRLSVSTGEILPVGL